VTPFYALTLCGFARELERVPVVVLLASEIWEQALTFNESSWDYNQRGVKSSESIYSPSLDPRNWTTPWMMMPSRRSFSRCTSFILPGSHGAANSSRISFFFTVVINMEKSRKEIEKHLHARDGTGNLFSTVTWFYPSHSFYHCEARYLLDVPHPSLSSIASRHGDFLAWCWRPTAN
jgi:hypothetical protein